MTYLGSKGIKLFSWTTEETCTVGNSGQKIGHLAKMYYFRLHFALFEKHYIDLSITSTTLVLNMTYLGRKYIKNCSWITVCNRNAENRGLKVGHLA